MAITKLNRYSLPTTLDLSAKTLTLPSASVTAHVTQTDLQPIKSDISALALREATNESSAAFNLPNQFIETFTDDTNLGTQTTGDRLNGYWGTVVATGTAFADDVNTMLLIHSNTTDGSTTITDSSSHGRTVALNGNMHHDTAQSKFGTSSFYGDGTGDTISVTHHADFSVGTGAYTMECWMKTSDSSDTNGLWFKTGGSESMYAYLFANGGLKTFEESGGTVYTMINDTGGSVAYNDNAWHHYAISRPSGSGAKTFVDGTQVGSTLSSAYNWDNTTNMGIGGHHHGTGYNVIGWIDEIRFSNSARYTGNFTPPTELITVGATGTLIQSANAVGSAKTKVGGTMLYKDNEGTATLGTDLKIYFTCDGGSNWTEATSYSAITPVYSTGIKQVRLGETTCTSGTDIRYKAVFANQASGSKETQLHGIGVNY